MPCLKAESIRNLGIIAHIDAGKTTLSERILFYSKKIHRIGEVHDGAATMDFMPEEQERGITITSACTTCRWKDNNINLVDTPGHVDFTIEVERCLRVMDGAVGVFCAVGGVEPQSETVWRQSESFNIPKLAFINKMDRQGANFGNVLDAMRQRLSANPLPLFIPIGAGDSFEAIIDLIDQKKLAFDQSDQGRTVTALELTPEEQEYARPWRDKMLENLAENNDDFLNLWLEGEYSSEDIRKAIKQAVQANKVTPVYCGSALKNIGVQPLMDGICQFLPSPGERIVVGATPKGGEVEITPMPGKPPVALIFKIVMENNRKCCFLRMYQGTVHEGDSLYNPASQKTGRVSRLYRLHADRREQMGELCAGDIAALIGFNDAQTGDTFCDKDHQVILAPIMSYEPVITLALEAGNSEEGKILDEALERYAQEDPTLQIAKDEETGARTISGMGELHLEVVLERLGREYKITPRVGRPQVIMRETIKKPAEANAIFDRELGKERHVGEVAVSIAPAAENAIKTGAFLPENEQEARKLMPPVYVDAVQESLQDGLQSGILGGWPLTGVEVTIENIKREEGLTTLPGLRMAAAQALRKALANADSILLEPLMQVEITTPEEFLGASIALFNQLGGKIDNMEDQEGYKRFSGLAPLRNLFGFSTKLRSSTQGRASFVMGFHSFSAQ